LCHEAQKKKKEFFESVVTPGEIEVGPPILAVIGNVETGRAMLREKFEWLAPPE